MSVLNCVKPGAKPGQILLAVDLSVLPQPEAVIARLEALGYAPAIRHVAYTTGVHVFAVLKDETPTVRTDSYLLEEWTQLVAEFEPQAVHLWRGQAAAL
ncbi:MAG: hypothetical protein RBJ76_04960 [Stenomitos frigidus ULC029]